jgi:hypothetical protein
VVESYQGHVAFDQLEGGQSGCVGKIGLEKHGMQEMGRGDVGARDGEVGEGGVQEDDGIV